MASARDMRLSLETTAVASAGQGGDESGGAGGPPSAGPGATPPASPRGQGPAVAPRQVDVHVERVIVQPSAWERLQRLWTPPEFADNQVTTAKYSVLTFIPVNLFEQFTRVANLYFLCIAGLQLIPGLSPTSWFTTVFPLACVLIFNAIKEGYDDYHRHKSDAEVNAREVLVLRGGGREVVTQWRHVLVGDLVKVTQDSEVPSDLVLLSSSDPSGLCFIETANLDGETNLKTKTNYARTAGLRTADELAAFADRYRIRCEPPNARLYVFDGAVVAKDDSSDVQPLTADNFLLRGCTLRKTDWVVGVAVFTGADSKIMMNRTIAPRKVTQMERHMNILVLALFATLFTISCFLAMGDQLWQKSHRGEWYLDYTNTWPDLGIGFSGWIIQVIRFIILLCGLIPISLYVTLEIIKVFQCVLVLNPDLLMYHRESDTPFQCHTTNLNEDLGQVEYVLSDKTGTLTQNIMGFVWASIGGTLYGKDEAAAAVRQQQQQQHAFNGSGAAANGANGAGSNGEAKKADDQRLPAHVPVGTPHSLSLDPTLQAKLGVHFAELAGWAQSQLEVLPILPEPQPDVAEFMLNLAVCNTVLPGKAEDGSLLYQASSPDEEALVQGAAYMGYRLLSRTNESVEVEFHGARHVFEVLAVLEFNSDRKRMSIICRCPDGKIRLYCKGADTMIMARIREHQPIIPAVRRHLEEMALAGYRTLCIAQRELPPAVFQSWHEQYRAASVALSGREEQMGRVAERIESELTLLGATAVEDKLQDGVPEAIECIIKAGIKVWVLTGDKLETAINIALSCRLFDASMSIVELRERDFEGPAGGPMEPGAERLVLQRKLEEVEGEVAVTTMQHGRSNVGLVVEGAALAFMLQPELQDDFVKLCSACKSTVFCRVSPMQKANVTKLVKAKLGAITLGIGDGANDVGMIQAAHIGCGISGREGRAAVMASDYSFAQFRYVARLLLVHGRSFYKRNCEAVTYSFYKNFAMTITYILYSFVTAYSCQPIYVSGCIATINLFWSSYVIVGYAILEQDVSPALVMKNPGLYKDTMRQTRRTFLYNQGLYMLEGLWHGAVIYFVPMYSMAVPNSVGTQMDWVEIGCTMYMALVITINLKLAMHTRYWTWITHLMVWASISTLFLFYYLYGLVWIVYPISGLSDMANIAGRIYPSPQFWLSGVLLAPVLSLLPDFTYMAFQRLLKPKAYQVFQEIEQRAELKAAAVRELGLEVRAEPAGEANEAAADH